jgi:hypothetical protein
MTVFKRCFVACLAFTWAMTATAAEEHTWQSCQATAALNYFQRGPEAEVEISVDTPQCARASGSFVVEIRIKADDAEEPEKLAFDESWSRDDGKAVTLKRKYAIGDNVQLLRIRLRKLSCSCDEETPVN